MKASRSSRTAEQMALSRALESRKAPDERICFDPYAEHFLSLEYRLPLLARPLRDGVEKLIERLFPGHHFYVIARTRYFDDILQQLAAGLEQLVILGAGYDSRAYRFADRLTGVSVFEVDHPATSAAKRQRINRALSNATNHVVYAPVDFNVETLSDKLRQAGYRDGRKTLFLWEGVTPYLSAAAVDEVLQFIRSSSAGGSKVLFDYVVKSVLDGSCTMRGARNEFEKMSRSPEPFTFGIDEGGAAAYLADRGFSNAIDVGSAELTAKYFSDYSDRYIKPWWRIVRAEVVR